MRTAVPLFLIFRVITLAAAVWVMQFAPPRIDWAKQPIYNLHDVAFTTQGSLRTWLEPWYRWDTGWYVAIAYRGYRPDDGSVIFDALYPLTMRAVAPLVGGDYLLAGLLVSNVSCLLALILLYKLVASHLTPLVAQRTLQFLLVFPAAFYLMAAYTESLFLVLVLGAWLAAESKRFWLSGALALMAALTRSQGWVLAFPLAYIAYWGVDRPFPHLSDIIALIKENLQHPRQMLNKAPAALGAPVGVAIYLLAMQVSGLGSVEAAFSSPVWQVQIVAPWVTIIDSVRVLLTGTAHFYDLINIAVFVFAAALGIVALRVLKPAAALYVLPTLAFILMRHYYLYQLHGVVRYSIVLFPIFIVLALLLNGDSKLAKGLRVSYIVLATAAQIVLITWFAAWVWVS